MPDPTPSLAAAPTRTPVCVQKAPFVVHLEPGRRKWCSCGLSVKQPFCDGAHHGTGMHSVKFEITEAGTYRLCGCKHSATKPFCDGTHEKL